MELEHSFTIPVPPDSAWDVLLDVERVAPCLPGATLDSVDGDEIKGRFRIKVGPVTMTYAGTARFTGRDPYDRVITLEASGKETRGAGTASATIRSLLRAEDGQTRVVVYTTMSVTGRPAQFGRRVMAEVGGKIIEMFAANLADMLAQLLAQPIEELELRVRSYNSLRRKGIHTVGDLVALTPEDLLAIEYIGPAAAEEIKRRLNELGLTLSSSGSGGAVSVAAAPPTSPPVNPAGSVGIFRQAREWLFKSAKKPGADAGASEQARQEVEAAAPVAEAPEKGITRVHATQSGRPKVFLCYRRQDTQGFARGIFQSLAGKYGQEQVFRDIDGTPAGVRFSTWIETKVGQCNVMIVLIGDAWSSAKDQHGQRRLDLRKDWVRQEIEVALRRGIPIIPVRVQGAPMPSEDELPPSIADLTGFQSAEVTDSRWDFDVGVLIQAIDNLIAAD
jgi:carbon monoxide dehydrogenase subunit G